MDLFWNEKKMVKIWALASWMLAISLSLGGCDTLHDRERQQSDGGTPCPGGQVRLTDGTCGTPCEGNAIRGTDGECHPCVEHEVARNNICACDTGFVRSGGVCVELNYIPSDRMGTSWHPDPEGDGIISEVDLCPDIYDPAQGDADGDKIGDACDPDFVMPVLNGPITGLHAEHVTPYGAWLNFRSPKSVQFSTKLVVAWSEKRADLASLEDFKKVAGSGASREISVNMVYGRRLPTPVILTSLNPGKTYYVAIAEKGDDGLIDPLSNVLEFKTEADPQVNLNTSYPRVWANTALIEKLKARHTRGDQAFAAYRDTMGSLALRAVSNPGSVYEPAKHCATAGLLYLITGDTAYREAGKTLFAQQREYWASNQMEANEYRWADAFLGICTDLLWNELDAGAREQAIETYLEDDEANMAGLNVMDDTDAYASNVRTWLIDGLVGCNAPGISSGVSARACALLDTGKRLWFGVQLVKARRNVGLFAQSGGALPDGSYYGPGTSIYWMQSFWALSNSGISPADYAQFIENNFLTHIVYPLTPRRVGYTTWGDVQDFDGSFDVEANSALISSGESQLLALHLGLLDTAGRQTSAGWVRWLLQDQFGDDCEEAATAGLLFVTDEIQPRDYKQDLPFSYLASGFGLLFDRLSWQEDASYLFFRGGWTAVDHTHADQGHFQFYRRGRWITHEAVGYSPPSATGWGHNVLLLQRAMGEGESDELGQFYLPGVPQSDQQILRASANSSHSLAVADTTGSYNSDRYNSGYYQAVQRTVLWLKSDGVGPDELWINDLVDPSTSAPSTLERQWIMQFDEMPSVSGRKATLDLAATPANQKVEIHFIHPANVSLTTAAGEGNPGDYPGPLYPQRLIAEPEFVGQGLRMLTLLRVSDAGTAESTPLAVSSADFQGALSGGDLVLFPLAAVSRYGEGLPESSLEVQTKGSLRAWITGLMPNVLYNVTATQEGETLRLSLKVGQAIPADSAGLVAINIAEDRSISAIYSP